MIGIIGAMEEEITLLREAITDIHQENAGQFEFITGSLYGKNVALLRCGIGKTQAAAGCTALIGRFKPSFIINTGCAGGVNPAGQPPLCFGDAVISSALVYHDFDIRAFGYKLGQVPGRKTAEFSVDEALIGRVEAAIAALRAEKKLPENFKALPGLIASGDLFVSDAQRVAEFLKAFPELRAVEMESTAIAHVCELFKVPCVALRCLSDIAGEESPVTFDEYLPIAAQNSSEIVKRLVADYAEYYVR